MGRKNKYEEGTWFLVPLYGCVFSAGVVARVSMSSKGVLLGYFFQNVYMRPPGLDELCDLSPEEACEALIFGDMGLKKGEWPILGRCDAWSSEDWHMPKFMRAEPISGRRYEVFYDTNDPAKRLGERELKYGEYVNLKNDSLFGHIAVQRYISHVLGYAVPALDIEKLRGDGK